MAWMFKISLTLNHNNIRSFRNQLLGIASIHPRTSFRVDIFLGIFLMVFYVGWLYGTRNKLVVTALFWLMGYFLLLLLLFHLQMGTRIDCFSRPKYIATSSVWRSHALVALGGVYEENVCIYRQEFIPVYTNHCVSHLP
jgi:hypothetical protein